jgi:hypothetical protein
MKVSTHHIFFILSMLCYSAQAMEQQETQLNNFTSTSENDALLKNTTMTPPQTGWFPSYFSNMSKPALLASGAGCCSAGFSIGAGGITAAACGLLPGSPLWWVLASLGVGVIVCGSGLCPLEELDHRHQRQEEERFREYIHRIVEAKLKEREEREKK